MQLQIPIPVSFELILETDKALIVKDIKINGDNFLSECNIPKMYATDLNEQKDGTYTANVEKWVLKQRKDETVNVNIEREIADLMVRTLPFHGRNDSSNLSRVTNVKCYKKQPSKS